MSASGALTQDNYNNTYSVWNREKNERAFPMHIPYYTTVPDYYGCLFRKIALKDGGMYPQVT